MPGNGDGYVELYFKLELVMPRVTKVDLSAYCPSFM